MINYRQIGMVVNLQDTYQFEEAFQVLDRDGYKFEYDEFTGTFLFPCDYTEEFKQEISIVLELENIYVNIQPNIQWG